MFHVYGRKPDRQKVERIGPEYSSPAPARQLKMMLEDAGYVDLVIRQKFINTDHEGKRIQTKTGRDSVSSKAFA